jgi:hypothetical protein
VVLPYWVLLVVGLSRRFGPRTGEVPEHLDGRADWRFRYSAATA